jgi:integrase
MGSKYVGIKARAESSIEIGFSYKGLWRRETIRLKPTAANLKRAANHRASILHEIDLGTFVYALVFPESPNLHLFASVQTELTIEETLKKWFRAISDQKKSSTIDGYRKIVFNQLIPQFGHISVYDFRAYHFRDWIITQKQMSNKRIKNVVSPFRRALALAVSDEVIEKNFLTGFLYERAETYAQIKAKAKKLDPFNMEEMGLIYQTAVGQVRNLFWFAFWSGMRTSELCALLWEDIDFINGTINVDKGLTQAADEAEPPKTEAGERIIKMLPQARKALMAQKEHTFLAGKEVFIDPLHGKPWTGDQPIRKRWTTILRKAGIRYRRPYQTRHTYASMMLTSGEKLGWYSRQLGHKNVGITTTIYAKWIETEDNNGGSLIDAKFGDAGSIPQVGTEPIKLIKK